MKKQANENEKYYVWGNEDFLTENELLETCSLVTIPPKRMHDLFIISGGKKKRPNRKQMNILNQKYIHFMKNLIKERQQEPLVRSDQEIAMEQLEEVLKILKEKLGASIHVIQTGKEPKEIK